MDRVTYIYKLKFVIKQLKCLLNDQSVVGQSADILAKSLPSQQKSEKNYATDNKLKN